MFKVPNILSVLGGTKVVTDMGIFDVSNFVPGAVYIAELRPDGNGFFVPTKSVDLGGTEVDITAMSVNDTVTIGLINSAEAVGEGVEKIVVANHVSGYSSAPVIDSPKPLTLVGAVYQRNPDGSIKRDPDTMAPLIAKSPSGKDMIAPILFTFVEDFLPVYCGGTAVGLTNPTEVGQPLAGKTMGAFVAGAGNGESLVSYGVLQGEDDFGFNCMGD